MTHRNYLHPQPPPLPGQFPEPWAKEEAFIEFIGEHDTRLGKLPPSDPYTYTGYSPGSCCPVGTLACVGEPGVVERSSAMSALRAGAVRITCKH